MDVAVIAAGVPIRFSRSQGAQSLGVTRLPRFTFHDTGLRARTSDCVSLVANFRESQPQEGSAVDERMAIAARHAMQGLAEYDSGETRSGLEQVAQAMRLGHECFERWGLVPASARVLREDLLAQGALGARITGAGGGGMIVALWS